MKLSVRYLEEIQESGKLPAVVKAKVSIILAAINDWPNPILNLNDYEKEIYKLTGDEIDKKKLVAYISKIDYSQNAWEAESLSQLIEIYNYYEKSKPLKEILEEIRENIYKEK